MPSWTVARSVTDGTDTILASDHNTVRADLEYLGGSDGNTKTGPYTIASTLTVSTGGASITGNVTVSSGTIILPNGSASAPSIASSGDSNTGTFYPAADTIAWATGGSERIRVDSSGNVGIGTSSPSYALDVASNSTVYTARFKSPASNGSIVTIDTTDSNRDANLTLANAGTTKWWFISSSSNSYRLYINDADANDGVYMAQNTTAWTANSDSRLKDVQGTITDALAKVGQLTGVRFTWKRDADNPDAKVRVGLIAQDVQAVLPEAVDDESPDLITDEETGKVSGGLGVRYTEVVPLLVNAIKELTARVVALEAQVASA